MAESVGQIAASMVVNTAPALEALEQVNVAGDLVKKTFREIDAQGKAYTVTLNLLKSAVTGEAAAITESTKAKDLDWVATTKLTDAEKGLTDVESKQMGVVQSVTEIRKKAVMSGKSIGSFVPALSNLQAVPMPRR